MATITLPVFTKDGKSFKDFDVEELSFTRSIIRQGRGARAAWRRIFTLNLQPVPESHAVIEWNDLRELRAMVTTKPKHGIRAAYHRSAALRDAAFASAREQVGGLILTDEHDPNL